MLLQRGWTDTVFPSADHDCRTLRYSIRREHQVNRPRFEGPAGTSTCYFNNFLPFCIIFSFSFTHRLFFYLSHLLMYFSIFFWLFCEYSLWFYFSPCADTKTTCQCSMLFTKLQKLCKTSTPIDYCHKAIAFFLAIFVICKPRYVWIREHVATGFSSGGTGRQPRNSPNIGLVAYG